MKLPEELQFMANARLPQKNTSGVGPSAALRRADYGASKTAQLMTVRELAERLEGSTVTINAMHPGGVKTNIGNNNGRLYGWYLHTFIWPRLKDPVISGEALHYLAATPELAGVSGEFFNLTIEEKPAQHALDRETGEKVRQLSEALTGLGETK